MTEDEAKKVQAICNTADGYCHLCAEKLLEALQKAFPEHTEVFQVTYDKEHRVDGG